jgi:hypothetical protein
MMESLFPADDSSTAGVARAWQQQQIKAQLQQLHGAGAAGGVVGAEAEVLQEGLGLVAWASSSNGPVSERRSSAGVDGDEDEDSSLAAMLAVREGVIPGYCRMVKHHGKLQVPIPNLALDQIGAGSLVCSRHTLTPEVLDTIIPEVLLKSPATVWLSTLQCHGPH